MHVRGIGLLLLGGLLGAAGCGRTGLGDPVNFSAGHADAGTTTKPCGRAACLATLFASCVPEGTCVESGGGSPSAAFTGRCYGNGVDVASIRTAESSSVTVRRDGTLCYSITSTGSGNASAIDFIVRGRDAVVVAEGTTADKEGTVTMTCKGGQPTPVERACLAPVDGSAPCVPGLCP